MSYTILSFCGGGIRGLFSSTLLQRLFPGPQQPYADLMAGCSTGSTIISWLLAGKTPSEIVDIYKSSEVGFYSRQATNAQLPAYDVTTGLLNQMTLHGDKKVDQVQQKVLFTSFNIGGQVTQQWGASLFTNLFTDGTLTLPAGSTTIVSGDVSIADAVMSSSAMPGMLGSVEAKVGQQVGDPTAVPRSYAQTDGAFQNHDPTLAAVALAVSAGANFDDINVICVGTGLMPNWIASDTSKWGAYQWLNGDGNPNSQTQVMFINGTVSPIANLGLNGTSTTQWQDLSALMMPGRFVYLNAVFDRIIDENDVNQADLDYMVETAMGVDISAAQQMIANNWGPGPGSD
jgi:patatin-like phospholipase/acyl hydrolase